MTRTNAPEPESLTGTSEELYGFRDAASGMMLRFYTPARRFDLWSAYVAGARRTYERFRVEGALRIPDVTPSTTSVVFAVASDDGGTVRAGWYTRGPLLSVRDAHAPAEFASEPFSAALVADWIEQNLPEGVIEMKGAWVDPATDHKSALADLLARSYIHAMDVVGVTYAFGTAAEHAAPRWGTSGAQSLSGLVLAAYPDERYRTTFLWWSARTSLASSSAEQRELFDMEQAWARGRRPGSTATIEGRA